MARTDLFKVIELVPAILTVARLWVSATFRFPLLLLVFSLTFGASNFGLVSIILMTEVGSSRRIHVLTLDRYRSLAALRSSH